MSTYLDGIPGAVATIVSSCYGSASTTAGKLSNQLDDTEKRIIEFTDKLTRTIARALVDVQAGK